MNVEEIKKLGKSARIEVSDQEAADLAQDMEAILGYVQVLESLNAGTNRVESVVKNVMREDDDVYTPGEFSEDILDNAPDTQNGFIKVKKVL
jgi:aspartyl-tRNA(Asn)/glutamyl-tRNA(Gln) amidotransferase subunit C